MIETFHTKTVIAGLTGGIATGKSTVGDFFRELGAHIIDADLCAKKAVVAKNPAWHKIVAAFGVSILQADGEIDRAALGQIVFNDPVAQKKLEAIVHPVVRQMMLKELAQIQQAPSPLTILDIPLLFESGWDVMVETVIVVYTPETVQLQRLMARDGLTDTQAKSRINAQMPIATKRVLANVVIDNSRSKNDTEGQVRILYNAWTTPKPTPFIDPPRPDR